ncbi:MAG: hypothetical protein A3I66_06875 [Burkholderiales bacterium RIFCSPLOWO2_02_FULL_57_36]|nr:MAG: hypothetical protein A3I66_06875 [Burkholderiales bacterium RIFCSPLOWO2_02_FULL_57_36]
MNARKLTAAVIIFAAAGAASAEPKEFVAPDADFVSSKTRAEVMAELKQAQANDMLSYSEDTYPVTAHQNGMRTRTQANIGTMQSAARSRFDSSLYFGA